MALFDFIRNFKNNNTPQIQAVIQDQPIMNSKQYPLPGTIAEQPQGNGLFNKIRGKIGNGFNGVNLFDKYENPTNEGWGQTTNENGDTVLNTAAGTPALTKRGFLNDLGRGMNENFYNKFNVNNWGNNTIDNMPKNFANRLGEGLGSFTRFLSGVGGDAWTAGTQGLNAALERQKVRTGDQLYRNALKDYGYNTDDIGGYIDKDTFNILATNAYKQNSLQVKQDLANAKDNLSYMKILLGGLNNGTISPEEVQLRLAERGLTLNDLREANNDKKVTIEYKGIPTHKTVDVRNTYEQKGGTGSKYGTGGAYVKIQAPDGTQATVPAEKANYYIQKGGKLVG